MSFLGELFGGSSEQSVEIPKWLEDAAKANLAKANQVANIGFTPYYGPEVAAFNPMQTSSMQNTADASAAFGLSAPRDVMAGMPQAQDFGGGIMGYSSMPIYENAMQRFADARPGQKQAIDSMFIDPFTGQGGNFGNTDGAFTSPVPATGTGATAGSGSQDPVDIMNNPTTGTGQVDYGGTINQESSVPVQASQSDLIANAGYGTTGADYIPTQTTMPYSESPFSGIDPQVLNSMPDVNTNPVTMDSFTNVGGFDGGYSMQEQDPSLMDYISQGAGTIGRNIVDNGLFGTGYSLFNDGNSLSDRMFGTQSPMSGGSTLVANAGTPNVLDDGTFNFDKINDFLANTTEFEQQPEVVVTNQPTVTAPESFFVNGDMLGQNVAGMSPAASLFEALNNKETGKNKTVKRAPSRTFNRVR